MRILQATTSYPRFAGDGAGAFVQSLARELARGGHRVTVLAPHETGVPTVASDGALVIRRFRYAWPARCQKLAYGSGIPWNLKSSWIAKANLGAFLVSFFFNIARLGRDCDVIHAHWGIAAALAIAARPLHRKPVVLTVHGSDIRANFKPIRKLTAWAIRRSNAVTSPSSEIAVQCSEFRGGDDRLCRHVPNGIDFPDAQAVACARASRPQDAATVICVGRLIPERRQETLIRAMATVASQLPRAKLVLVGDGPERENLERIAQELGIADRVVFAGHVDHDHVPALLGQADLYASATTVESFGMAVLEAAAWELPVVSTPVGNAAGLVEPGRTGYLIEAGDVDAMAERIAEILCDANFRRRGGRDIRRRAEQLGYNWPAVARQIEAICLETAGTMSPQRAL